MSTLVNQRFIWNTIPQKETKNEWILNRHNASLVYLPDTNKFFLIGGKLNITPNDNFETQFHNELNSNNSSISNPCEIEVYIYDPQSKETPWYKMKTQKGTIPNNRSNHKCVYIPPYIFLFGGIDISQKTCHESTEDLYVLNPSTYSWQKISSQRNPSKRNDFQWIVINNEAFLYGGESIQEQKYHNDLWYFSYNGSDLFEHEDKSMLFIKNIWTQIEQKGTPPEAVKSYAMTYNEGFLFLYGGINKSNKCNNKIYQFDLSTYIWELLNVQGNIPLERCYSEMISLNSNILLLYGGINALSYEDNNTEIYNDLYVFNIRDNNWSCPIIEGSMPDARYGFAFCGKYSELNGNEIVVLGGICKGMHSQKDNNKIYVLSEDKFSQFYSNVGNINYNEAAKTDSEFINSIDKYIEMYRSMNEDIEKEIQAKENENNQMEEEMLEQDRNLFQYGRGVNVNDKRKKDKYSIKKELKDIMKNKNDKTLEFFNETCNTFMNYYDSMCKIVQTSDEDIKMNIDEIKYKCINELQNVKQKLEEINQKEESLNE